MRFLNDQIMSAVAIDALTVSSSAVDASYMVNASLQAVITGAPDGALHLEASNDKPVAYNLNTAAFTPSHWTSLASVAITTSGVFLIPIQDICYQYVRATYIPAGGGAGTITVNIKTLGV